MRFLVEAHARPLRRSCELVDLSRSAWHAPPLDWTVRDAELIAALTRLVEDKSIRGFGTCCQRLRTTHPHWNGKRIDRAYCAMKLNLRRAARRRVPKRERVPLYVSAHSDTVWSADFMPGALACGRRCRTFNLTDDVNREIVHIEVDTSITRTAWCGSSSRSGASDSCRRAAYRQRAGVPISIDYNEHRPHDALGGMTPAHYRHHH